MYYTRHQRKVAERSRMRYEEEEEDVKMHGIIRRESSKRTRGRTSQEGGGGGMRVREEEEARCACLRRTFKSTSAVVGEGRADGCAATGGRVWGLGV